MRKSDWLDERIMQAETIKLTVETADDWWEIEALYDLCFAPGRNALSSYRLRDGVEPIAQMCVVARDNEGILAGAVRNWPVKVGTELAVLLGPIAVHPTRQGEGIAGQLIHRCIGEARALGWERLLLVGDAPYYLRYGFTPLLGVQMPPPTNPERVLGLALTPGAWDGLGGVVMRVGD